MITKAIVLAAGFGTRLRPFTCVTPKPLLPVWGVTMLDRTLEMLRAWGVREVMVNCHHLHGQVEDWVARFNVEEASRPVGERLAVGSSYEPEILGTGGVLNPLRAWIGGEAFYLVNGDVVTDGCPPPPTPDDRLCPAGVGCVATCIVTEEGPRTIEVEPESGLVTNWRSDDAGCDGTYTYCGIAALSPAIFRYVESEGFSSIIQAYERAMADGLFVKTLIPNGFLWTDAGTVESYIALNVANGENAFADIPQVRDALVAIGSDPTHALVEFLGARGSDRAFFRLTAPERGTAVAVLYDDAKRGENARYAVQAKWLAAHGIPVPAIMADLPDRKALVMEWGGSERKTVLEDAVKVVETLATFHALGAVAAVELDLEPAFSPDLWKWERDLFAEYCLGARFGREMPLPVSEELESVASLLGREPTVLVHRDFQSTNVLWKNGQLSFIDFQGMRLGPAAYDLAAYLYDPYAPPLTEGARRALVKIYAKRAGREDFARIVPFAAVQRLVQCLGAYGRLASVGQPQFSRFIMPALQNLLQAADEAGLDAVGALAEDLIAAEERRQETVANARHTDGCACGHHNHGSCDHETDARGFG